MDKRKELLEKEIEAEIEAISNMDPGSEDSERAIENLSKLYQLRIDEAKNEEQLKESFKDRVVKIGTTAAEIVVPIVFSSIWMSRGFKFEETGTYTSNTFKWLFNKFKFKK